MTAAVVRDLGFKDVKLYEPSWLGYAGTLSAPAEREVFVNVGALNARRRRRHSHDRWQAS